jgi:hypothetical protein
VKRAYEAGCTGPEQRHGKQQRKRGPPASHQPGQEGLSRGRVVEVREHREEREQAERERRYRTGDAVPAPNDGDAHAREHGEVDEALLPKVSSGSRWQRVIGSSADAFGRRRP